MPTSLLSPALRRAGPALLLAAVALAAHGVGLAGGFVWDDQMIITENPLTRDFSKLGQVLLSVDQFAPYYRPLCRASYLVDFQLWGMRPLGFHAVNLALAVGCVLAFHALARRLFTGGAPALLAGLLLAVHPLAVEAVAFVSARNNLLALLFAFVALSWFIDAERADRPALAWRSGAAFMLGLLSKEPALMALPVMGAWVLLPSLRARPPALRALRLLAPHLLAVAVWFALRTYAASGAPVAEPEPGGTPSLLARLALNAQSIPTYLGLFLFPRDLTIFHALPPAPPAWLPPAWLAIAAALGLLLWKRTVPSTVGLLWFAANLAPIANLVPLPTSTPIAERYFLFSAVGLLLVAADLLGRLWERAPRAPVAAGVALLLLALAGRTVARTLDWHDDVALATSAVALDPRATTPRFNLGVALMERGDLPAARAAWEELLRISPRHADSMLQLGTLAATTGDLATAERWFRRALELDSRMPEGWFNLGKLCEKTARPAEALGAYGRYLEVADPATQEKNIAIAKGRIALLRRGR